MRAKPLIKDLINRYLFLNILIMKQLIKTTILLLAILLPALATAADFVVDGICYNINGNEAAVASRRVPGFLFIGYSGAVVIPATVTYDGTTYPVTSIEAIAFWGSTELTNVDIPNSITEIGQEAFGNCPGLTSIVVDSGNPRFDSRNNCNAIIETADNELIAGCKNTIIPNSVTKIGNFAFEACSSLTSIVIPNSVTEIGHYAFYSCDSLTSIDIPNSVIEIGYGVFEDCPGLTSIVVESGNPRYDSRNNCNAIIETADNTLIYGCKNTTIPNSVTTIGDYAFSGCHGLTSIDIPDSVTEIGFGAFESCTGLTSIVIPNSVTAIGGDAFNNTAWYKNQPNGMVYAGKVAYKYKGTMPSGTNMTFKEGTLGIAGYAFEDCTRLTSIVIPNTVISIGDGAFYNCSGLTSIVVESGNPRYDSHNNCNAIIETASNTLIAGCKNTTIPKSVTAVGDLAFAGCDGLTSIVIPNSVTSIGDMAFAFCDGLTSIVIPNSVTEIDYFAFYECFGLTDVYCYIADLSRVSTGYEPFYLDRYDYSGRTLHVLQGTADAYRADENWYPYFGQIVEDIFLGDVNRDLEVNIADVNVTIDIILGGNDDTIAADVNGDGEINIADINAVIDIVLSGSRN